MTTTKTTEEKIDFILDIVQNQTLMLAQIIKQRKSNKEELLTEEIKFKKRMTVKEVEKFLGISRPWSLKLMEKISKNPGFGFQKGNTQRTRQSIIIFTEERRKKEIFNMIEKRTETKPVTYYDMMTQFEITIIETVLLAEEFIKKRKGFEIINNNKIVKTKP